MQLQRNGLMIYDDYAAQGIRTSSYGGSSIIDYYDDTNPFRGEHAIRWKDGAQYETIVFDFHPDGNFALLTDHNYELSFCVRANSSRASFDIRFVDTKTSASDHPWRMGKTIDQTLVPWDGEWHNIIIPLADMEEKGSWDNGWHEPNGEFQWPSIDRLEIVAEQSSLSGVEFFFDDIQLVGEEIDVILGAEESSPNKSIRVYPNPVSTQAIVEYSATCSEDLSIFVYNQKGQLVRTLFQGLVSPGTHTVPWFGDDDLGERVSSGLYLVRVQSDTGSEAQRLIVLN